MRSMNRKVDVASANAASRLQQQVCSRRALIQFALAAGAARIGAEPALARHHKHHRAVRVQIQVDQQHLPADTTGFGHGLTNTITETQTFTVGRSGKLTKVSVGVLPLTSTPGTHHLIAEIFPVDGRGAPDMSGAPLASGRVSTAAVPPGPNPMTDIALSPQIAVEVDQVLALALHADAPAGYGWFGACCADYYQRGVAGGVPDGDFYFQTFVERPKAAAHLRRTHHRRGR